MKAKFVVLSVFLLSLICAGQQKPATTLHLYDNFNQSWIDPTKWEPIPTCSATQFLDTTASLNLIDCTRAIEGNRLRLMVKAYGGATADTDRKFGPSELYFANPQAINTITVKVKIMRASAFDCPSNTIVGVGQALVGGTYFNIGTGDAKDDVGVAYFVEHEATELAGEVHAGAVVLSPNSFYGYVDLGLHQASDVLTLTAIWDQPNHQFLFRLADSKGPIAGASPYSVPDTMPAVAPMKLLAARAFVPNCTTQPTSAAMDAFFEDVYTN